MLSKMYFLAILNTVPKNLMHFSHHLYHRWKMVAKSSLVRVLMTTLSGVLEGLLGEG
jgi:ABC-type transporter Mla maintaining outer membrane lipid asymmetry permease subunit MlaE